jgi:homeobox protein cut-like
VIQLFSTALVQPLSVSVKYLESQITELERESERMSRAQEAQRAVTSEVEVVAAKKVDDISKDISKKVRWDK